MGHFELLMGGVKLFLGLGSRCTAVLQLPGLYSVGFNNNAYIYARNLELGIIENLTACPFFRFLALEVALFLTSHPQCHFYLAF